jgi:DeoR family transcriptional regulator, aga operon transcriptional repressor
MNRAERLGTILERLSQSGSIDVEDLVRDLDVSPATVRRDLQSLHEQRLLERTHGGAVAIGGLYELPMRHKTDLHRDEKTRIARAAAEHVREGMTVALTGGTTTTEVSRMLVHRGALTVVTNAVNIAAELAVRPNVRLIVSGGVARAASYELVGPLADDALGQLNTELAFVGVNGITAHSGLTTHDEVEARTDRVMVQRAARVIVVADGSKVGTTALARIVDLDPVERLITTPDADKDHLREIATRGVEIEVV